MSIKLWDTIRAVVRKEVEVRQHPASSTCLNCTFGQPIIYDQHHDCCTTCKVKWDIRDVKAD